MGNREVLPRERPATRTSPHSPPYGIMILAYLARLVRVLDLRRICLTLIYFLLLQTYKPHTNLLLHFTDVSATQDFTSLRYHYNNILLESWPGPRLRPPRRCTRCGSRACRYHRLCPRGGCASPSRAASASPEYRRGVNRRGVGGDTGGCRRGVGGGYRRGQGPDGAELQKVWRSLARRKR